MNQKLVKHVMAIAIASGAFLWNGAYAADKAMTTPAYDAKAYTQYVHDTMKKLDKLYLQFCGTCGVAGDKATKARKEYVKTARDLMQYMNARFDKLDPRVGDALSGTEVLVNIHALTMITDVLTASYMESVAEHPYK